MPADSVWPPDDPALEEEGLIDVWREDDRVVIGLYGEHDMSTDTELSTALASFCGVGGVGDVIVDLSQVSFVDSVIITSLLRARNLMQRQERRLVLRAPSAPTFRILQLCGLTVVLQPDPILPSRCVLEPLPRTDVVPSLRTVDD